MIGLILQPDVREELQLSEGQLKKANECYELTFRTSRPRFLGI
jgi:hypothetical protein